MTTTSLDAMVNDILLKRRYGLQWYLEFLLYVKTITEELSYDGEIDSLRYVVLPINDNYAIQTPNDYIDWVRVSAYVDGYIHPLVPDNSLSLVPNYDENFVIQPYSQGIATQPSSNNFYNSVIAPYWWLNNWNMFGENLGRQFGGVGVNIDTFRENRARNEIKINEAFYCTHILLEYTGNGSTADNATHVDVLAKETIQAYAMWKFMVNNRTYGLGDAATAEQEYIKQRQILRARKSDLTVDVLRRIVSKNSIGVKQ